MDRHQLAQGIARVGVVLSLGGCGSRAQTGWAEITFEGKPIRFEEVTFGSGLTADGVWKCFLATPQPKGPLEERWDPGTLIIPELHIEFWARPSTTAKVRDLEGQTFPVKYVSMWVQQGKIGPRGMIGEAYEVPAELEITLSAVDARRRIVAGRFTGTAPFTSRDLREGKVVRITDGVFEARVSGKVPWWTNESLKF